MLKPITTARVHWIDAHPALRDRLPALLTGLASARKRIPTQWLFDEQGVALARRLAEQPDYYPARLTGQLLRQNADTIASTLRLSESALIQMGCGCDSHLASLLQAATPKSLVAVDLCETALADTIQIASEWTPQCTAVLADYQDALPEVADLEAGHPILLLPGIGLGGCEPAHAQRLLSSWSNWAGGQCGLLVGVDLHKPVERMQSAFRDDLGFYHNALSHINRTLGVAFDTEAFTQEANYDAMLHRLEVKLRAQRDQRVRIQDLELVIEADETLQMAAYHQFNPDTFIGLAGLAGFRFERAWYDDDGQYGLFYFERCA